MRIIDTFDKMLELVNLKSEVSNIIVEFNNKNLTLTAIQNLITQLSALQCSSHLILKLRKNNIDEQGAQLLAQFLISGKFPPDSTLDLYENHIGTSGAQYFSEAVASGSCPKNVTINVEVNDLGPQGAQCFATALSSGKCPAGFTLQIGGNNIAAEGAQAFALALATGKCPRDLTIDFIYSEIGQAGAQFLAHTLQHDAIPANLVLKGMLDVLKLVRPAYKLLAKKWLLLTSTDTGANAQELNSIYVKHGKLSKVCLHTLADAIEPQQARDDFIELKNYYKNFLLDVLKELNPNTLSAGSEAINALKDTRETLRVVLNDWISSLQYHGFRNLPGNLQHELGNEVNVMRLNIASSYVTAHEWTTLATNTAVTSELYLQAQQALAVRASLLKDSNDSRSTLLYLRSVLQLAQSIDGHAVHDQITTVTADAVTHHPKYQAALRHMQYAQQNLHTAPWVSTIERVGKARNITLTGPHGKTLYRSFAGLTLKRSSYDDGSFLRRSTQSSTSSTSQTQDDADLPATTQLDNLIRAKK